MVAGESWRNIMADTLGQRLARARDAKGLTLEDVARATKIRVPRLRDLEADDYSGFPSLVYARGFLKNYSAFLGIDASEVVDRLDAAPGIDADGYQYLNQEPVPGERARRKPPSKLPRLIITTAIASLALLLVGAWLFVTTSLKRLYPDTRGEDAQFVGVETPDTNGDTPDDELTSPSQVRQILEPSAEARASAPAATPATAPAATPAPAAAAAQPDDDKPVMRAIPVDAEPQRSDISLLPTYEVSVQPVERSWVKIIRDNPDAPPVFEDYLAPGENPLVFTGSKFWITVMERDAIIVRRNGVPVVFDGTAVVIE